MKFRENKQNMLNVFIDESAKNWEDVQQEGQLAVDVFETKDDVIVISTMAGADTSSIEVFVHSDDLLTIKGRREPPELHAPLIESVHQECFWGSFSRTVILPVHVKGDQSNATYKNGILTLIIPKSKRRALIPIEIIEE